MASALEGAGAILPFAGAHICLTANGSVALANSEPYDVEYFARKHNISSEQARDLIRQIGNDRDKLNAAASKLFRK